jgi:hypothetical protein
MHNPDDTAACRACDRPLAAERIEESEPALLKRPAARRGRPDLGLAALSSRPAAHALGGIGAASTDQDAHAATATEADKGSLILLLVLVFIAILGVGAGGLYLNIRDTHPEWLSTIPGLRDAPSGPSSSQFAEQSVEDPSALPPPAAGSAPAVAPVAVSPPAAASSASEPPPKTTRHMHKPKPATKKQAEATRVPVAKASPAQTVPPAHYKVIFRRPFGPVVAERSYASEAMKHRAQQLWTREQKILEPDGRINSRYAPKKSVQGVIPGH